MMARYGITKMVCVWKVYPEPQYFHDENSRGDRKKTLKVLSTTTCKNKNPRVDENHYREKWIQTYHWDEWTMGNPFKFTLFYRKISSKFMLISRTTW